MSASEITLKKDCRRAGNWGFCVLLWVLSTSNQIRPALAQTSLTHEWMGWSWTRFNLTQPMNHRTQIRLGLCGQLVPKTWLYQVKPSRIDFLLHMLNIWMIFSCPPGCTSVPFVTRGWWNSRVLPLVNIYIYIYGGDAHMRDIGGGALTLKLLALDMDVRPYTISNLKWEMLSIYREMLL